MASNQDTSYQKRSGQRRDVDDPCQICNGFGHTGANCVWRYDDPCQICDRFGHTGANCFWRYDDPCQICDRFGHTGANCFRRYSGAPGFQANVAVSGDNGDSNGPHQWFPDTGATNHATPDSSLMTSATSYDGPETLRVGNGTGLPIVNVGSASLATDSMSFKLHDVLHVPGLSSSLLSVQRFAKDNNVFFEFHPLCFYVKDILTKKVLFKGHASGGLYTWPASSASPAAFVAARSSYVWHMRLGHPHSRVLRKILASSSVGTFNSSDLPNVCSSCQLGKSSRFPLSRVETTSTHPLELIYSDIWGPAPLLSASGFKYFVLFVDDYTRYMWYYPMRAKSDLYAIFDKFRSLVERSFSRKIISFQSDLGGEYKKLGSTLASLGIRHRQSCAYTHEQNGRVERKHRHVVETGLALMAQSSVPSRFWDYAFETAVYLINKMPTPVLSDKSPHYLLHRSPPSYSYLRVFGCLCFPNLRPYNRNKLQFRSSPCVFLGYPPSFRGYRCLDTNTNKVFICRHVRFDEAVFPFVASVDSQVPKPRPEPWGVAPIVSGGDPTIVTARDPPAAPIAASDHHRQQPATAEPVNESERTVTDQPAPRPRGRPRGRSRHAPSPVRSHGMNTRSSGPHDHVALSAAAVTPEPTCFTQAVKFPEWRDAMDLEFNALVHNNTWRLVPFKSGMNVVGCKWVFRTKRKADGSIERYKARLVAKGFNQIAGEDFFETFSPVVKPTTVRLLLSLAISRGWTIRQLDIHNAFLNGNLAETVYMRQPPGYEDKTMPGHVCLLQRSLYGLKQAPRAWFTRLHDFLVSAGFSPSKTDVSLFIYSHGNTRLYFLVYVDDILVMGSDPAHVTALIDKLALEFKVRDMGVPSFFLGIETIPLSDGMLLSQQRYMKDILKRAGMVDCKPVATPVSTTKAETDAVVPYADPTQYRSFAGALQYLTVTRPDLSYAVNRLCQHMHSPSTADWAALKRVLRYVNRILHLGLKITSSPSLDIHAYSDSDWAGNPDDRKSTSGFAVFLGTNLVSWVCRKQRTVARSSTEAEYKGLADVSAEVTWLVSLMKEIGFAPPSVPKLWCDNLGATYLCANPVFHARTKHIEIDYHFVRDKVAKKELQVNLFLPKIR
jgi:hypothetical protein